MRWPDIFFKAKPTGTGQVSKPSAPKAEPDPGAPPATPEAASAAVGQVPASAPSAPPGAASTAATTPSTAVPAEIPPSRLPVFKVTLPPPSSTDLPSDNEVLQDMAEADTLRAMSRTAGIRLVRRDYFTGQPPAHPSSDAGSAASPPDPGADPFIRIVPATPVSPVPPPSAAAPSQPPIGPRFPSRTISRPDFSTASASTTPPPGVPPVDVPPARPAGVTPGRARSSPNINLSTGRILPMPGTYPSAMTIVRRRMKMADVARIVLPPRRDDSTPAPPPAPVTESKAPENPPPSPPASEPTAEPESAPLAPEPASAPETVPPASVIVPPSFGVPVEAGTFLQNIPEQKEQPAEAPAGIFSLNPPEKIVESIATEIAPAPPLEQAATEPSAQVVSEPIPASSETSAASEPPAPSAPEPIPVAESASAPETVPKPAEPAPSATPVSSTASSTALGKPREKREFVLSNGERIIGCILSETPEAIYLDHGTLGVLTIPRNQIALRPVEIILINGDRIVGDIVAETADSLFVKHASLGILTVPRNQRSSRVVEAILKDGDRILGEVLGETENFTVIRSATLGTVAVPHNKVAMLHRRAEQVEMKSLPAPGNPSPS